jgi:hypothetical protein
MMSQHTTVPREATALQDFDPANVGSGSSAGSNPKGGDPFPKKARNKTLSFFEPPAPEYGFKHSR